MNLLQTFLNFYVFLVIVAMVQQCLLFFKVTLGYFYCKDNF